MNIETGRHADVILWQLSTCTVPDHANSNKMPA